MMFKVFRFYCKFHYLHVFRQTICSFTYENYIFIFLYYRGLFGHDYTCIRAHFKNFFCVSAWWTSP